MLQLNKILLAKDFSSEGDEALHYALDLCGRTGAELHTVYVDVIRGGSFEPSRELATQPDKMSEQLEKSWEGTDASERFTPQEFRATYSVVRDVDVAEAILKYATDQDVDLIVTGTRGRSGFRRLLLGSVAAKLVRYASCPVITVDLRRPTDPTQIRSILVPVDFSAHNADAIRAARYFAALYGASLDVLNVVDTRHNPEFYSVTTSGANQVRPEIKSETLQRMKRMYREIDAPEVEASFSVLDGEVGMTIARLAEASSCGLVVMSTHGRTGLKRFALGSIAEKVVRLAPCPVLTLREYGKSLPFPQGRTAEFQTI